MENVYKKGKGVMVVIMYMGNMEVSIVLVGEYKIIIVVKK